MSDQTMTIGITGPRRRAPWRGGVVVLIIAAIVLAICLILLGLTGDFLVDWLWFSTIGYLGIFWTTIVAEAEVFFAVFVATANGNDARRRRGCHRLCNIPPAGRSRGQEALGPRSLRPR